MKGAAGTLGLKRIQALSLDLEMACRNAGEEDAEAPDKDRLREKAAAVEEHLAELDGALRFPDHESREGETSAVAAREPAAASPVDESVLSEVLGTDPAARRRLLEKFLTQAREALEPLASAREGRDAEALGFSAHRIKSSALAVGATRVGNLCRRLETLSENRHWGRVDALLDELEDAVSELDEYLRQT